MVQSNLSNARQIKRLEELCDLVRGTEPGSNSYFNEPEKSYVKFIRVGDITEKVDNPKFISEELNNLTLVNPEEILISFDGTPGVVVKGWTGAISSGIRVIRNIKPEILEDFLFYYLQTPNLQQVIKFYTTGMTILHASRAIPHIKIPIPPLPIQQKNVERLDAIKKAQELNDRQVRLAEELFQSLLHEELDQKWKNWEIRRLGDLCEKIKQSHPRNNFRDKFRYIDISSVDSNSKSIQKTCFIDAEKAPSRARKLVQPEDVLFATTRPYLENIAFVPDDFGYSVASTGFCVIRANKNLVMPEFLYFIVLSKPFIKKVLVFQRGASYPAVSDRDIYSVKISLPSLETQHQIVQKLQAVQDYKKKLLEQKEKLQELFDSVLNKSFKGKLVK